MVFTFQGLANFTCDLFAKENEIMEKAKEFSRAGNRTPATAVKTPDPNH